MKAPSLKRQRCTPNQSAISRRRGYASFMYTARQQVDEVNVRLSEEFRGLSRFVLQRVGSEAARMSCFRRHRVLTSRDVLQALGRLRRRERSAPLVGA
ncbi:hypothetical protein DNTS_025821 [Danionella cerebrum]|uniref:Histone H2A/H2B/H3 domain-containing protein n=1 Tax=Danionella cerebrum TaxID=2873325 RepID=A0A553N9Z0_9TELE|nr:hypothetical protein DNTS_025821 [Danionella translucida]